VTFAKTMRAMKSDRYFMGCISTGVG